MLRDAMDKAIDLIIRFCGELSVAVEVAKKIRNIVNGAICFRGS